MSENTVVRPSSVLKSERKQARQQKSQRWKKRQAEVMEHDSEEEESNRLKKNRAVDREGGDSSTSKQVGE